jgi:HTH-type transcriptional repressor of NAD biosynthesis genes
LGCNVEVDSWIINANRADLYLFLETDCPFIQDGTRLNDEQREKLNSNHKKLLIESGIKFITLSGNWEERFTLARDIIDEVFLET